MSKRESMTAFEEIVIDLYNQGVLTRNILVAIWNRMSRELEMDAGGYGADRAKNGRTMPEIVCELLGVPGNDAVMTAEFYFWDVLHEMQDWSQVGKKMVLRTCSQKDCENVPAFSYVWSAADGRQYACYEHINSIINLSKFMGHVAHETVQRTTEEELWVEENE